MEPASLALGILPVIGGAVKAYKSLQKTFRAYCHYSRDMRRLGKHFDREEQFFINEAQLLIRPPLDDYEIVEGMIGDTSHPSWHSIELERQLTKHFGRCYDVWQGILEDINGEIDEFKAKLQGFDQIALQRQEGESLKNTVRRLRHRVKVTFEKDKLETNIEKLRSFNHDLERLRRQTENLQTSRSNNWPENQHQRRLAQEYGNFKVINKASKALHHALTSAWCSPATTKSIGSELRHNVKLFADAKVEDGVHMDIAIICYGHESSPLSLIQPNWRKVQVHSQIREWVETGLSTPPRSDGGTRKRRRVHFTDDCSTPSNNPSFSTTPTMMFSTDSSETQHFTSADLSGRDLCSAFSKEEPCLPCTQTSGCLGYIDNCSEEIFRHSFYQDNPARLNSYIEGCMLNLQDLVSMDQILSQSVESSLTIVNQLRLARDLTTAVLKFHSTPWLGPAEFPRIPPDSTFGTDFVPADNITINASSMEGLQGSSINAQTSMLDAYEEAKFQYGVRNITLWSLGTILLQIGRWNKIESPDDVVAVRKLSSQVSALGPRYQQLTNRCLECDFGYGEDLSKPRLQKAVYESLVCELSDMISSLDLTT